MKEYIEPFWVGLMDGDGSIQVNNWKHRYLQYRLIIKLKYTSANYRMLNNISNVIGGHVKIAGNFVLWVENHIRKIQYILTIFDHYPPLTSRLQCQLVFAHSCLQSNDLDWYSLHRNLKYESNALSKKNTQQEKKLCREKTAKYNSLSLTAVSDTTHVSTKKKHNTELFLKNKPLNAVLFLPEHKHIISVSYFHAWLSGFIEAEGCFSIRQNGNHSFSIGQNNDKYLILAIKEYFHATNMIRTPMAEKTTHTFYLLEIYRKERLMQIIAHCKTYPLLGQKNVQFVEFVSALVC
jgi:hypothetical protein